MEHHPSRSPASGDAVPQVLRGWLQAFRPHVIGRTWQNLLLVMGALLAPGGSAPRHHLGALRRKPLAIIFVARREPVQGTLEIVARELGVTAADLSGWREAFLEAGAASLKARARDDRDKTIDRLRTKVGELTMDTELLQAKIERLEAGGGGGPFGSRRSKR